MSTLGAVVIGAGQAGLAASYHLAARGIDHVVVDRRRIGSTWLTQRWDTFALNTPGWRSHLRTDDPDRREDDDAFLSATAFVGRLEAFATHHGISVRTGIEVTTVRPLGADEGFVAAVAGPDGPDELYARNVVVASGSLNVPRLPAIAALLPADLPQVTAADYRSPGALPAGAVLVVGSAQTGVQFAEDLVLGGRTVFLCTSKVGRMPRRYRGRDSLLWLGGAGFFDVTPDRLPDPGMVFSAIPQVSGVGPLGHTVSLQSLAALGVALLGRPTAVEGDRVELDDTVGANIAFGDRVSAELKGMMDRYIDGAGIERPPTEPDPADEPHPDPAAVRSPAQLDLHRAGVGCVVWATGFGGDFGYLPASTLDERGAPAHVRGASAVPGLYVVGFPWQTKRKSGIIQGVDEDAATIADHIARRSMADVR